MSTPIIIQDTVSVAGVTTIENIIAQNTSAQRYIRPPMNVMCKLFLGVSAVAAAGLRVELIVDGKTIMDSSDSRAPASAAALAQPDDMVVEQFFCPKGAQIVLRAVNANASALSTYYRIEMHEAAARMLPQRITQRYVNSVAAGATVQLLTGLRYERPVVDSLLSVFATASAAGFTLEVLVDGQSVAPAMPVNANNRPPINPYDMLLDGIEVPDGSLIEMRATNTTGGALNFFWRTALQDLVEQG